LGRRKIKLPEYKPVFYGWKPRTRYRIGKDHSKTEYFEKEEYKSSVDFSRFDRMWKRVDRRSTIEARASEKTDIEKLVEKFENHDYEVSDSIESKEAKDIAEEIEATLGKEETSEVLEAKEMKIEQVEETGFQEPTEETLEKFFAEVDNYLIEVAKALRERESEVEPEKIEKQTPY
jgi:hypothetical protein